MTIDTNIYSALPTARYQPPEDKGPDSEALSSETQGFFGKDGLSFRDVLDAVNPLNHIPVVSGMLATETGHEVSTASKLIGGALIGGPVGFLASLANVVFEQATGKGVAETMVAALTGSAPETTQLATADTPIRASATEEPEQEIALIAIPNEPARPKIAAATLAALDKQKAVLDLYGGSAVSAQRAYSTAQMRPYLNAVTHSQVL